MLFSFLFKVGLQTTKKICHFQPSEFHIIFIVCTYTHKAYRCIIYYDNSSEQFLFINNVYIMYMALLVFLELANATLYYILYCCREVSHFSRYILSSHSPAGRPMNYLKRTRGGISSSTII